MRSVRVIAIPMAVCGWLAVVANPGPDTQAVQQLTRQGREFYQQGHLAKAASSLEAALKADPDHIPAVQIMAVVCHLRGRHDDALDYYAAVQRASIADSTSADAEQGAAVTNRLARCEAVLCFELNEERLARDLQPCIPDPKLAVVARQHSEEMRDLDYFSHDSPRPAFRTIADRFKRLFPDARNYTIAENLGMRYSTGQYSLSVTNMRETHDDWMASSGHRRNILHRKFDRVGVGAAVTENGDYWVTEFMARIGR